MMRPHDARRNDTNPNPKEGHMNRKAMVRALSLLICGVALIPGAVQSASWISGVESYAAPWQHVPIKLS